ncbi:MAG: hypothetical protein HKP58_04465 [Desulfatitalea sp.]|nr:hypothetical protein [Desulfatitalea sp.]NNJ99645.1 hypothetical protein [Desulfatitalea sp.]
MFKAVYGDKMYDEAAIEQIELKQSRIALRLLKSGKSATEIFTEEQLSKSDELLKKTVAESNGKLKSTNVKFQATGMSADEFLDQFWEMVKDTPTMLAASPDHFLIGTDPSNLQVIEYNAGLPTKLVVKFGDEFLKVQAATPDYPLRMVAKFYLRDAETYVGGVLHELRTTKDGFDGIWGVYYPIAIPDRQFEAAREHTVVEVYNWYRFAMERLNRKG